MLISVRSLDPYDILSFHSDYSDNQFGGMPPDTSKPRRQHGISAAQRLALRHHHRQHPSLSQKQLQQWFEASFHRTITQPSISESLSAKYSYLDDPEGPIFNDQLQRQRAAHWPELERALFDWQQEYQQKAPITGDLVKLQAGELWKKLQCYEGMEVPQFSNGWLAGFKGRHKIKSRKCHGEANSVDTAAMEQQLQGIRSLISQYQPQNVYNCDETGLFFKLVPDRSLTTEHVAGVKQIKARITLLFCCNADGSHKLPIWFVGKHAKPRCFGAAGINIAALNCVWKSNAKAWITGALFGEWMKWFSRQVNGRQVLLVMDNFSAHITAVDALAEEGSCQNVKVVYLPPNTTSHCQPLDQGIISSFKARYRRRWLEYMLQEFNAGRLPLKTMNVLKALMWSVHSWKELKPEIISNCWQHSSLVPRAGEYGPLTEADETQRARVAMERLAADDRIHDLMAVESFLNPEDEQVVDATVDNDQLLDLIAARHNPPEPEDPEEVVEEVPRYHYWQAIEAIALLRAWKLQQSRISHSFMEALDEEEELIMEDLQSARTQRSIESFFTAS